MSMRVFPKLAIIGSESECDDVVFFDEKIPNFAESALDSLYQCVMSTLSRFRQYYPIELAKTYVAYNHEEITALIIFRIEKNKAYIYNEQINIPVNELVRFARSVFKRYPMVSQLSFYALDVAADAVPFAHHRVECLEDIWLKLPKNSVEYMSSLGKKTAETIRRAEKKILRDHPSFRMEFFSKKDIGEDDIFKIMAMNRLRMADKGVACHYTDASIGKLIDLVRQYGLVGLALINGEVCGGVIQLRVGSHWFAHSIAHHPDFDAYRLGQLCNYYGVVATIDNGGGIFHFGWGRSEHKYRMGACNRELFRLEIYRGPLSLASDLPGLLGRLLSARRRSLKLWVALQEQDKNSRIARSIRFVRHIRAIGFDTFAWLRDREKKEIS